MTEFVFFSVLLFSLSRKLTPPGAASRSRGRSTGRGSGRRRAATGSGIYVDIVEQPVGIDKGAWVVVDVVVAGGSTSAGGTAGPGISRTGPYYFFPQELVFYIIHFFSGGGGREGERTYSYHKR